MENMENKVYHTIVEADNKGTVDDECSFSSSESDSDQLAADPLSDMSSLFQKLPIKRGLSKYYEGKAQSFSSLGKVRSLEDLAKPENPYNKRLKSCRSYGGRMGETQRVKCTPRLLSLGMFLKED